MFADSYRRLRAPGPTTAKLAPLSDSSVQTNRGNTASHCVILRHTASYSGAEGFTETNVDFWSNTSNFWAKYKILKNFVMEKNIKSTTIPLRMLITTVEIAEYMDSAPITPNTNIIYIHTHLVTWLYKNACIPIVSRSSANHWSSLAVYRKYSNENCAHKGETEASQYIKIDLQ